MDLLVSLCAELFCPAFLLSSSLLCDWQALLGCNRRKPPSTHALFCSRTILTRIRSRAHSLPTTLFGVHRGPKESRPVPLLLLFYSSSRPSPQPLFSASPLWNEHFSRPETFNLAPFWRKLIETCPTIASFLAPVSPSFSFHDCESKIVRGLVWIVALNGKKRCYFFPCNNSFIY